MLFLETLMLANIPKSIWNHRYIRCFNGTGQSNFHKRDMIKDFTSDKFIGSSRRITKGWEITVRNSKNKDVNIILEDQFPLSSNKDIEVEKLEYSGGTIEETTGKVTWNLTLKPNEVKKLTIKYLVKFPKEKRVVVY